MTQTPRDLSAAAAAVRSPGSLPVRIFGSYGDSQADCELLAEPSRSAVTRTVARRWRAGGARFSGRGKGMALHPGILFDVLLRSRIR